MGRRASFSTYRGSVWLTTTVVLLGISILLLFKPVSSAGGMGVDFGLGANMLTMGPFVELFEKNPDAYYSHLVRNMIAFQFGFLGAYVYFIGSVVRAYFTLDLTSHTFVDGAIRMIVASILALVLSFVFDFLPSLPKVTSAMLRQAPANDKTSDRILARLAEACNRDRASPRPSEKTDARLSDTSQPEPASGCGFFLWLLSETGITGNRTNRAQDDEKYYPR